MDLDNRHLQIDELLKRDLNDVILREVDFPKGCLVTITKVETTKNIKEARIYISVLPGAFTGKVLSLLRLRSSHFVYLLRKKMAIKHIPDIEFVIDDGKLGENEFDFGS